MIECDDYNAAGIVKAFHYSRDGEPGSEKNLIRDDPEQWKTQ